MSKLTATTSDSAGGTNKKDYGVVIKSVQINNIELPKELIRAMSKQAEAEREKEARVTKALGEFEAARKFKEASDVYKGNFEAMRLRELQTYQEIGTEHNTLMMVIPSAMANPQGSWVLGHVKDLDKKDPKEKKE
jgi:regulator of protease activity HflC (stomatin/prohibitin superfamily)